MYICKAYMILKLTERKTKKLGISKRQISKQSLDTLRAERQEKREGRDPQLFSLPEELVVRNEVYTMRLLCINCSIVSIIFSSFIQDS